MRSTEHNPVHTSKVGAILSRGCVRSVDGAVWMYRVVPTAVIEDARSIQAALERSEPLNACLVGLGKLPSMTGTHRAINRKSMREIHLLWTSLPELFHAPGRGPLPDYLNSELDSWLTSNRSVLIGVRLVDKIGGKRGLRGVVESVASTIVDNQAPLEDFEPDIEAVSAVFARAGVQEPSESTLRRLDAWWNRGRWPDTPILPHSEHLHVFTDGAVVNAAEQVGFDRCAHWDYLPGSSTISFVAVSSTDFGVQHLGEMDPWLARLASSSSALAISIRGRLEPSKITREELRRNRARVTNDLEERVAKGKMERSDEQELLAGLAEVEGEMSRRDGATLIGAHVTVALPGVWDEAKLSRLGDDTGLVLVPISGHQRGAMAEMMIASAGQVNPHERDWPTELVSCSGIASLSTVGDLPDGTAHVGFTEIDRQSAWFSPIAHSRADEAPITGIFGDTGSGKTMLGLWLACQWAVAGTPVIFFDPKTGSDHSAIVLEFGGTVRSLDEMLSSGVYDPVRFSPDATSGVALAVSLIISIDPFGSRRAEDLEVALQRSIDFGVKNGARCTGDALILGRNEGLIDAEAVEAVLGFAASEPLAGAMIGIGVTDTGATHAFEGLTLIKVGERNLDLPDPGSTDRPSISQRVASALVRQIVFGSAAALRKRDGVVMFDEGWVVLDAGQREVERLGRLARSWQVLPIALTQRVSDALDRNLQSYISRALILPLKDPVEASAACRLAGISAGPRTDELVARLTRRKGTGDEANWASMRALRDPLTGETLRGAIAIYVDLDGEAVPVEVVLPDRFLKIANTTPT